MSGAVEIYEQSTNSHRKPTTNYYPILARAVAALRSDSEQTRAELYERARDTLVNQLKMIDPPLSGADVAAEMWALEAAIARISPASRPSLRPQAAPVRETAAPVQTTSK